MDFGILAGVLSLGTSPSTHSDLVFTYGPTVVIYIYIWRFPKIRGTFLGGPIIRIIAV